MVNDLAVRVARRVLVLLLALTGAATVTAGASDGGVALASEQAQAGGGNYDWLGQIGGRVSGLALHGDRLLVGTGPMLRIYDLTNPSQPLEEGSLSLSPGRVRAVDVAGDRAYVAADRAGLFVIRLGDGEQATVLGRAPIQGRATDVAVVGDHAYVAAFTSGVQVLDVSDPAAPRLVHSVATEGAASSVDADGSTVYVGDTKGVRVIDAADPATASIVGVLELGNVHEVLAKGDAGKSVFAVLSLGANRGLNVLDVSDPSAPRQASRLPLNRAPVALSVLGSRAFLATRLLGLAVVDIADPANMRDVGSLEVSGGASGVLAVGDGVVLAPESGGLAVVDVTDEASPSLAGGVAAPGRVARVSGFGDHALVADSTQHGLWVVDAVSQDRPRVAARVSGIDLVYDVQAVGDRAYVAGRGLLVLDVSSPSTPRMLGAVGEDDLPLRALHVAADLAFAARYDAPDSELVVINVRTSEAPREIGTVALPGRASRVTASGTSVFVSYQGGVHIVDVQNPTSPRVAGHVSLTGAVGVAASERMLYVGAPAFGLMLFDVSDPSDARQRGQLQLSGAGAVWLDGDVVHVAGGTVGVDSKLWAVDVHDAGAPSLIASTETGGLAHDVHVVGGTTYVADDEGGLVLLTDPGEVGSPQPGAKVNYMPAVYR